MPLRHLTIAATLAVAATATAADTVKPRIVGCDEPVRSGKRGICANHLDARDFAAIAPGVSWFYNWHFRSGDVPAPELKIDYLPMAWGNRPDDLAGLQAYLDSGARPRAVLAINEPNLKGQAFIDPQTCADLFKRIKTIADAHKLPVVGPNMALGSAPGDSITAQDPLEKKPVTYTWFVPYLKAFHAFAGPAADKVPVGVHSYKDIYELKWAVETAHKEFGGPVWVTEFAQWGAPSDEAEKAFLMQAVDWLENTDYVAGYAWFKERVEKHNRISLLGDKAGDLTPLGEAYVAMPVHDADLFYRLPGRLQAERYREAAEMELKPTTDDDGFADMAAKKAGAAIDLNVAVENPGRYVISIRVDGEPGTWTLRAGNATLASFKVADGGWQTITATADLGKGLRSLHLQTGAKKARINWIEFTR